MHSDLGNATVSAGVGEFSSADRDLEIEHSFEVSTSHSIHNLNRLLEGLLSRFLCTPGIGSQVRSSPSQRLRRSGWAECRNPLLDAGGTNVGIRRSPDVDDHRFGGTMQA